MQLLTCQLSQVNSDLRFSNVDVALSKIGSLSANSGWLVDRSIFCFVVTSVRVIAVYKFLTLLPILIAL